MTRSSIWRSLGNTFFGSLFLLGGCSATIGSEELAKVDDPALHSWVRVYSGPEQNGSVNTASVRSPGRLRIQRYDSQGGDSIRIGRGFDSAKEEWLGNCVQEVGLDTLTGSNSQQTTTDHLIVKSLEEVTTNFGVGVKVSVGLGDLISGGGEFRLAQDSKLNRYSTSAVVKVHVEQQAKSINHYLLHQWVIDSINSDPTFISSGKFAAKCGNGFASGYRTGGELLVLIARQNDSAQDKLTVESNLDAKIGGLFSADANVRAESMKVFDNQHTRVWIYSQGTVSTLPDMETFLDRASKFPLDVAAAGGWPISVRVTPYTLVENFPDLDSPRNQEVARVLTELGDYRRAVLSINNDNVYIDLHKSEFDLDATAHKESLAAGEKILKMLTDAAIACYQDNRCEIPALPALPRKPVGSAMPGPEEYKAIWQQGHNECPLPDQVENCLVSNVAAECKQGQRQCKRGGDGAWRWTQCAPYDARICVPDGTSRDCITPPYDCPGAQTFSRTAGWGQCTPKLQCECKAGMTRNMDCINGALVTQTCNDQYHWTNPACPAIPETCDGRDNDLDMETDELPACHQVIMQFTNVDDEALVWLNTTEGDNNSRAICRVRGGTGYCDLSGIMAANGNPNTADFIVKFLNGGCGHSSGRVSLQVDGKEQHYYSISSGPLHCGYFYRQAVNIDFAHGTSVVTNEKQCALPTDCIY